MPILLGKFASEAYKAITTASTLKSWDTWKPHWPVLVILIFWFIGYLYTRYSKNSASISHELYNFITWFCEDIYTRKDKKKDIRCTIWVPLGEQSQNAPIRLVQVVSYFPLTSTLFDDTDKRTGNIRKNGRPFRTYKVSRRHNTEYSPIGILGRTALRAVSGEEPIVIKEQFSKSTNFIDHMMNYWNFTEFQAERLTPDRKSYLCLPMVDNKNRELLGILYFDSRKTRTFDNKFVRRVERYLPRFASIITSL